MVGLYKDPKGETIFERTSVANNSLGVPSKSVKLSENENLRKRIKELEDEIKQKDVCNILSL